MEITNRWSSSPRDFGIYFGDGALAEAFALLGFSSLELTVEDGYPMATLSVDEGILTPTLALVGGEALEEALGVKVRFLSLNSQSVEFMAQAPAIDPEHLEAYGSLLNEVRMAWRP